MEYAFEREDLKKNLQYFVLISILQSCQGQKSPLVNLFAFITYYAYTGFLCTATIISGSRLDEEVKFAPMK